MTAPKRDPRAPEWLCGAIHGSTGRYCDRPLDHELDGTPHRSLAFRAGAAETITWETASGATPPPPSDTLPG